MDKPLNTDTDGDGILDSYSSYTTGTNQYNRARPKRHNGGANYLFADGHVEWVSLINWCSNWNGMWGPASQP